MSIYLGSTKVTGTGVQVDGELSATSYNPVANAPVSAALETLGYEVWNKPAEWVDIRSGALGNSVYFLVGHNNTYPSFSVNATVSNTGTYDIFIDGIKQFTTASGTTTVINWATLNLQSGYDITYPQEMRAHIVRVTPTISTNTLSAIHCTIDGGAEQAVLWAHFTISNAINLENFLAEQGNSNRYQNRLCEAVTAVGDEVAVTSSMRGAFRQSDSLLTIPKINLSGETINAYRAFTNANKLKKIRIKNGTLGGGSQFFYSGGVEKIETENVFVNVGNYSFSNATNLKELPPLKFDTRGIDAFLALSNIGPTFLDLTEATGQREIRCSGSSANPVNLVGITVSPSAPFDGSSPQIDIRYTGLNRNALVNLFNSMPYNVGYEVVGSPTITDGVVSGFSATSYVTTTSSIGNTEDDLEIVIAVNNATVDDGIGTVIGGPFTFGVSFNYSQKLTVYVRNIYDNWILNGAIGTSTFANNTNYLFKFLQQKVNGSFNISILSSADNGNTWTTEVTTTSTYPVRTSSAFVFGGTANSSLTTQYQRGSIDLNNTYIKVNGVPWFTGAAAMTKTCSIVGCTGAADLTQDDKNIALNKGWELTVA